MRYFTTSILIAILPLLFGCSDDSSGPEDLDDLGEATLNVSGDINANHTGQADFWSEDTGVVNLWELTMYDFNPQTFSLSFLLTSSDPIARPGPGNYEIVEANGFNAVYEYIENQDFVNTRVFIKLFCDDDNAGELTITNSSDSEIRGNFNITISEWDFDDLGNCVNLGTVNIKGDFRATERISQF